jgi:hypothetical protein
MSLAKQLTEKTFEVNGVTHKLSDHVRKTYAVEERINGGDWHEVARFNNSTDAKVRSEQVMPDCGQEARLVVVELTNTPKKSFWELWRHAAGKRAIKAAGVFVVKDGDSFVLSPSIERNFWRQRSDMRGEEGHCFDAAFKDAIRDGDGAGSRSERENLNEVYEYFQAGPG